MPTKDKAAGSGATGALIVAVVALGLGFYAGYVMGGKQQWSVGYAAGAASTRKEMAARIEAALGTSPQAEDVKTVSGKVLEKNGDTVTIETPQLVRDPLADPAPTRRTVRLTPDTKVVVVETVPQAKFAALDEEYRKKQDAYIKDIEAGKQATAPVPPSPLSERAGTLSDIAVGQDVAVTAKTGILRAATIDAESVRISPTAPAPRAPDAATGTAPAANAPSPKPAAPTAGEPTTSASSGTKPAATAPLPPTTATGTPTTNAATGTK